MARTLTARQREMVDRAARAPIPMLKVSPYSDRAAGTVDTSGILYLADRPIIYDFGNTGTIRHFHSRLIRVEGSIQAAMEHLPPARGGADPNARTVQVVLSQVPLELGGDPLLADMRSHNLRFASVEIAELDRDYLSKSEGRFNLRQLVGDEHVTWGRFEIESLVRANADTFTLSLRSVEPEIPSVILNDAANNDPRDVGKRLNRVYGAKKRQPCHGVTVGFVTTLAEEIAAGYSGTVKLTDVSGLSGTFKVRIAGDEIAGCTLSSGLLQLGGPATANHKAGTIVLEVLSGNATWCAAGHAAKAIDEVYIENPYNGEIVKVDYASGSGYTKDLAATVSGVTASTFYFTPAQLKALLDSLDQSPTGTVTHAVETSITQYPSSTNATTDWTNEGNAIDGNETTAASVVGASSDRLQINFAAVSGSISSQVLVFVKGGGNYLDLYCGSTKVVDNGFTAAGEYRSPATADTSNYWQFDPTGGSLDIYEVYRIVYFEADPPTADIAAAEFGFGLRFYADVQGYAAPDGTNYSVASGALLEHPSDILRHLIAVVCGKGHGAIDDASFDAAVTNLSSSYKMAVSLWELGDSFRDIAGAIAHEAIANLIQVEGSTETQWKLLTPSHDSGTKKFKFTGTPVVLSDGDWLECEEVDRSGDGVFTRFRILYNRDGTKDGSEDAFRKALRADADTNDLSSWINTADFATAEDLFGRREHPGIALLCIDDDDTAKRCGAYYAQEHMREARIFSIDGLPWWSAYDREIGDLLQLEAAWDTGVRTLRIVEHQHGISDSGLSVLAVEVLT